MRRRLFLCILHSPQRVPLHSHAEIAPQRRSLNFERTGLFGYFFLQLEPATCCVPDEISKFLKDWTALPPIGCNQTVHV